MRRVGPEGLLAVKNGEWLGVNSEDVKKLRKGETTAFIEELTEELDLDTASSCTDYCKLCHSLYPPIKFTCW